MLPIDVRGVSIGGGSLVLIAGPCVIESEAHAVETALALRDITRRAGVPFIFKASYDKANRTSGSSFRGPGLTEGVRILGRVREAASVPILTDIHEPAQAAAEARRKARRASQRGGHQLSKQTLDAADWVILITSLKPNDFATADVLALYRLRWRIELAFKRLKSLIGLKGPPGTDERSARPHVLAHLLTILLLEPLMDELEDSPRLAEAA